MIDHRLTDSLTEGCLCSLGKIFSSDNRVSSLFNALIHVLTFTAAYSLVYVHMYAAYDIRQPICDSNFFPSSHLYLAVMEINTDCEGVC